MRSMDRRDFLKGAAGLGGAVLLAGCGSSGRAAGGRRLRSSTPPISKEPGNLSILEWGGYEAAGTKAQTYGMIAGKDYTSASTAHEHHLHLHHQRRPGAAEGELGRAVRPHAPLPREHPRLREPRPRAAVRHLASAQLLRAEPVPGQAGPGQRPAVHDPVGLGLRQRALPHRQGRPGRRHRLGAVLEQEVLRQDLGLERQRIEPRVHGAHARLPEDGRHEPGPDQPGEGDADPAEAAEQVLLEQRVRAGDAAGVQVGRHLDHLLLAGRVRVDAQRRPEGGLHEPQRRAG